MPLDNPAARSFRQRATNPYLFPLFLFARLPSAWFVGLRVRELDEARCVTTVPYSWWSQNPFQSTYFAAQAMAAELSTGALVLLAAEESGVRFSTLVVRNTATFGKKATSLARFTCEQGADVFAAVREAKASGEAREVTVETVGRLADGAEVSRFTFTWSVKPRASA